jgi:Ca2+-binding EF-hand superfamily protein
MAYRNLTSDDVDVLTRFFAYVDADNDGFVTTAEIVDACKVDVNGDGYVDAAELQATAGPWLAAFGSQDSNADQRLTLDELLISNDTSKGQ